MARSRLEALIMTIAGLVFHQGDAWRCPYAKLSDAALAEYGLGHLHVQTKLQIIIKGLFPGHHLATNRVH